MQYHGANGRRQRINLVKENSRHPSFVVRLASTYLSRFSTSRLGFVSRGFVFVRAQSGKQPTEVPVCGSWNLRDKKMFDNKRLNSWAVVSFAQERELPLQVG